MLKICAGIITVLALVAMPMAAAATDGKAVFEKSCKTCHGPTGDGNPAIAKAMKVELKPLSSAHVQAKSDAELKETITKGVGKMKLVAGLSTKQVDDVIAYVRTLKK